MDTEPGIARLSVDLEIEYRTVRDVVALLRRLGLIRLVAAGAGRGRADEYRLTLPADLLDRDDLQVWTPAQQTHHTRQVSDCHRGRPRTSPHAPAGCAAAHGPQDPATYQDLDTTPTDTSTPPNTVRLTGPTCSPACWTGWIAKHEDQLAEEYLHNAEKGVPRLRCTGDSSVARSVLFNEG
ncbi:hypothetical protein [Actinoplanes flavus]|uniref:Uncharacterized protein n=1 Tax=Actinoplanes flavus TaxID=2820290 RepID=A0ABS3UZM2_9ACTN|nr:hypothetical protein [Actinoplanes flavus]MBO3744030.1 hypothetical protein [Actinoplanes flavus]